MTNYTDIITRLEAAGGATQELARPVAAALFGPDFKIAQVLMCRAALSDGIEAVGASLALVEEKLPGWAWSVGILANGGQAYLMRQQGCNLIEGKAPTPPLAVLLALFRALNTTEET